MMRLILTPTAAILLLSRFHLLKKNPLSQLHGVGIRSSEERTFFYFPRMKCPLSLSPPFPSAPQLAVRSPVVAPRIGKN